MRLPLTVVRPLSARSTVATLTPAARATSARVARFRNLFIGLKEFYQKMTCLT
jgi:hypothetical protein